MSYRLLCDENVERVAVPALAECGFDAIHVTDRPGAASPDPKVARTARTGDRLLVTNDDDFLTERYSTIIVLYYPENDLSGFELAGRIEALHSIVPSQVDLPPVTFLTESNVSG